MGPYMLKFNSQVVHKLTKCISLINSDETQYNIDEQILSEQCNLTFRKQ